MPGQLAMVYEVEPVSPATTPKPRAGDYLCTYCWSNYGLTDAPEFFSCRTCGRGDRLVPSKAYERHGFDMRCPSAPPGLVARCCPDDVAAACPVCGVYEAFAAGANARLRDELAGERERQDAMPYVDFVRQGVRCVEHSRTTDGAALRLWDEHGYAGALARLRQCSEGLWREPIELTLRRFPLSCARVWTGELAPEPTP